MDKRYRDGTSMQAAVLAHLDASVDAPAASQITPETSNQPSKTLDTRKAPLPKRMVKPFMRLAYRIAKPMVKPFADRVRRYFAYTPQLLWILDETVATKALVIEVLAQNRHILQELTAAKAREMALLGIPPIPPVGMSTDRVDRAETLQDLRDGVAAMASALESRLERVEALSTASVAYAKRFAVPCGPDEILIRTEAGYVLCSCSDVALITMLVDSGDLERGTRLLIERILVPGDVFIDVGANVGMHTLAAARALRGSGRVIAFEPFEPTYRLLCQAVFVNGYSGLVDVHRAAVADRTGDRRLFLGQMSGHHSLYPLDVPSNGTAASVDVPVVTLDEALAANLRADLIKIDVEGAELGVVAGAHRIIEANPGVALIVELGPSHLTRTGSSVSAWLESFARLGLTYRRIEPLTGALEARTEHELAALDSSNLLFAHPDAEVWRKAQE